MTIGEITKLEGKLATVQLTSGEIAYFDPTHRSVTHGQRFTLGDRVSIRYSRNNLRVASVVLA